jgi:hypothetical protein
MGFGCLELRFCFEHQGAKPKVQNPKSRHQFKMSKTQCPISRHQIQVSKNEILISINAMNKLQGSQPATRNPKRATHKATRN